MTDKCHFCGGWNACCSTKVKTVNATGANEFSAVHPHEPDEAPLIDAEGRCLVCFRIDYTEQVTQLAKERDDWRELALDAIQEFEDARGYASEYFTEKWGYDETSVSFQGRLATLDCAYLPSNTTYSPNNTTKEG